MPIILLALLFTWAAVLTGACAPSGIAQGNPTSSRVIYGLTLQPSGFDPHIHSSSELGIPLRQVYDTLVYRHPTTKEFTPGLALDWSISPDGLVYTFNLRRDVTFHDGTPFNAQAVAANLNRIVDPETASQRAVFLLGPYIGYEIVDDYTIRIQLAEPYSPLLDSLSQVYLGIASPAALAEYSLDRYQFHQVGTGPYRMVEYVPGDRLVIRRNYEYSWGPSFYTFPETGALDEIEFRFFTDVPARALGLEGGDAQIMGELLPTDARALTANPALQIIPVSVPGQPLQFLMNTRRFPTDNVRVRQALLYSTNREVIIDSVFQRYSPIAWGPLSASTAFYSRDLINAYAFDLEQARGLIAAAGFQDTDNNGFLDFGGADIEISIIVPPWGLIPEVAQLLQDQWRTLGFRVVLNQVPSRSMLLEAVDSGNFNLVAFYEFGVDPSFLNRYFTTNGTNNWTGFSDPTLDQVLAEAVRQSDPGARASLYAQAQRIIMEQALILPIRDYVNLNGAHRAIQELAFDAYGWFPLLANTAYNN